MILASRKPLPKYQQLAAQLREQIASGALQPGDRLPTLAEMRRHYGASRTTTEKVYDLLQKEGLIERPYATGTFVAHPPRRAATGTLGLCGPIFNSPDDSSPWVRTYWARVMEGICEAAERAGTPLLPVNFTSSRGWEKVDGLLVSDWRELELNYPPAELPRVLILMPNGDNACACADDYQGARVAIEYLLQLGHRRIAYLHGPPQQNLLKRISGYWDVLREAGIEPRESWEHQFRIHADESFAVVGRRAMAQWIADGWRETGCTALFCQNDETAIGAMAALREAGLEVPRDVSIVGFDGIDHQMASPILTTVAVPLREIGRAAVEILLRQIAADTVSNEQRISSVSLQPGASCAPLR